MPLPTLPDAPFAMAQLPFAEGARRMLAIACKATYAITEGLCQPLAPTPVLTEEVRYRGGARSVYAPRDLVPAKARPEVFVVGAAPGAQLRIGAGAPVPIEAAPPWPPQRRAKARTLHVSDFVNQPAGDDVDPEGFQFAPPSQQLDRLDLLRTVHLDGALSSGHSLAIRLPDFAPVVELVEAPEGAQGLDMPAELLWVDVDKAICTVTWRCVAPFSSQGPPVLRVGAVVDGVERWPTTAPAAAPTPGAANLEAPEREPGAVSRTDSAPPVDDESTPPPSSGRTQVGALYNPSFAPNWLEEGGAPPAETRGAEGPPSVGAVPRPAPVWTPEQRGGDERVGAPRAPNPAQALIHPARPAPPAPDSEITGVTELPVAPTPQVALDVMWAHEGCAEALDREWNLREAAKEAQRGLEPDEHFTWRDDESEVDDLEAVVEAVLHDGPPTFLTDLEPRLAEALRTRSRERVLALVTGELRLTFDPAEELRVCASSARPLARHDKPLAAMLDEIDELLDTPLASIAEVAHRQRDRLTKQWRTLVRDLPKTFLEDSAQQVLLDRRAFVTRNVLEDEHVRATFVRSGAELPLYLPPGAAKRLPLTLAFESRCIVDVVPRQDGREGSPIALVALAVARVMEDL